MGPAIPLDMTCASSLVAVHQATASLRLGEVDLALAGGVHVILSRPVMQFMREYGMLSRTGKCKTFDAAADGFVRGEGCGIVVLKRLSDAETQGDRIWGVVRGTAINQNGAAAALTVPNGTAQEQLFAETLSQTSFKPADVDYIEVHGTGSELGDPIEVRAAAAVYGRDRDIEKPLLLGTVKTNIGHLEAAAGVAGLIKVLLSMHKGIIPKQLHFKNPSPHVEWDKLPVKVTSEPTVWPRASNQSRIAGVSAFGISGTNAHILVECGSAREVESVEESESGSVSGSLQRVPIVMENLHEEEPLLVSPTNSKKRFLPLSGKSNEALRDLAGRYLDWLDEQQQELSSTDNTGSDILNDMVWTASVGRSHFEHRAGVIFNDFPSLREGLLNLSEKENKAERKPLKKKAFLFTGDCDHWLNVIDEIYKSEPVVQVVLNHCDRVLRDEFDGSLLEMIHDEPKNWDKSTWKLPIVYAMECAFTALWSRIKIRPDIVVGRGVGTFSAAQAAGALSLEEGLRLAMWCGERLDENERSDLIQDLEARLTETTLTPLCLPMVSGSTTRTIGSGEVPDLVSWFGLELSTGEITGSEATLAHENIDTEIVISPATEIIEVVARAYKSGHKLDFTGLFAGEMRRRISIPNYPFQRQSYWFN